MRKLLFLIIINALCISNLYATKIYKRAPFTLKAAADDVIVVEYDLSESRGLHCSSSNKHVQASFTYKGRDKIALLPITLQNYRVPVKVAEELADTSGNVMLMLGAKQPTKSSKIEIECQYSY